MKVLGIIPARMGSSRFYGKPLADIGGKSMIQRVYEQASKSNVLSKLVVATDHAEIFSHVISFGGKAIMTSELCENGTERCAEALLLLNEDFDVVINIQGDEPFFEPESLNLLVDCFKDQETQITTLVKKIEQTADIENPTVVKVVFDENMNAMYFSRSAIPYNRDGKNINFFKHIGIYAFRGNLISTLSALYPTELEEIEKLEQLRWMQNGYKIKLAITQHDSNSVDTPEDLENIKKMFNIV